jgi:hypothetical protein
MGVAGLASAGVAFGLQLRSTNTKPIFYNFFCPASCFTVFPLAVYLAAHSSPQPSDLELT